MRARLLQAAATPGFAYERALQIRQEARRRVEAQVFDAVGLLVLPTLADVPHMAADVDLGGGPGVLVADFAEGLERALATV